MNTVYSCFTVEPLLRVNPDANPSGKARPT